MLKGFVDKYIKAAGRDVKFIDEALQKGAYPSFEEWHDFVFKADVAGFKSDFLAKYTVMYPNAVDVAKIEGLVLASIINVQINGFTVSSAKKAVKAILRRVNKHLTFVERMRFVRSDKDGTVYFGVESYDSVKYEKGITDRDSLCEFLVDVWSVCLRELKVANKETVSFLESHLKGEISTLKAGKRPTPYFGCMSVNTLEQVVKTRTGYEASLKRSGARKGHAPQLKVAK